jgi:hypothetical protein
VCRFSAAFIPFFVTRCFAIATCFFAIVSTSPASIVQVWQQAGQRNFRHHRRKGTLRVPAASERKIPTTTG